MLDWAVGQETSVPKLRGERCLVMSFHTLDVNPSVLNVESCQIVSVRVLNFVTLFTELSTAALVRPCSLLL